MPATFRVPAEKDTPAASPSQPRRRGGDRPRLGFTLTELLVVIAIIAVLASLASVGVMSALGTARQTRIKTELDQLDLGMKSYREKYGSYPPVNLTNPASNAALRAHIVRAFPRYDLTNLANDLTQAGVDTTNFRPDQALVFWLQGFSSDPLNPFITPAGNQITAGSVGSKVNVTPLFNFDKSRLWQVSSSAPTPVLSPLSTASPPPLASYFPQGTAPPSSSAAPYLYWDATYYGTAPVIPMSAAVPYAFNTSGLLLYSSAGVATPYWFDQNKNGSSYTANDTAENWANPDSFQIISAGVDGKYGGAAATTVRMYPTGGGTGNYDVIDLADDDNVTNFNQRARLADAQ